MNTRLMMIGSALMASLFCLPAIAQPGPGMGGPGMSGTSSGMVGGYQRAGQRGPRDCMQTANPEACKAHQQARLQARQACKDKAGPERRQCMGEQMQNFDCSKSSNPQQCEARKKVYQECKSQTGPAFRQCVQQKMPMAECSKAVDPQRCELNNKAREACKDKYGPEHMACLREQFNVK